LQKSVRVCFSKSGAQRLFEPSDLNSIEGNLSNNDEVFFVNDRDENLIRQRDIGGVNAL
jgi:hypothetical protein